MRTKAIGRGLPGLARRALGEIGFPRPTGQFEELEADINPENSDAGKRKMPFGRELWIEQEDFKENPPSKFFRLAPGREVRLKYAYYITCTDVIKDPDTGEIKELHCTYDPSTKGGWSQDGRKVKGTSHWISAAHAVPASSVRVVLVRDSMLPAGYRVLTGYPAP